MPDTDQETTRGQQCPECGSPNVEPFVADYDWWCRFCGHYFDVRDEGALGEIRSVTNQ